MQLRFLNRRFAPKGKSRIGCTYLLFIGLVTSRLLVINSLLVRSFIATNDVMFERTVSAIQSFPLFAGISPLQCVQFAQVFFPVVMIMLEFWTFDILVDWWRRGDKETADN